MVAERFINMDERYIVHRVRKNSGRGLRIIEEPNPELKIRQKQLAKQLASNITFPSYVNGVSKTSTLTNSKPHVLKAILYKIDLKDFFHTVRLEHITRSLPNAIECDMVNDCMYDGRLPTGAPTSPILANIAFLETDKKIIELLRNTDIAYTRYMDDLSFSSNFLEQLTPDLVNNIFKVIKEDGWVINRKKSGLSLNFNRQEVTGVVVNQKINISKDRKLLLRAKLDHLARKEKTLTPELAGELAYLNSLDSNLSIKFTEYFNRRVEFYNVI